MSSVPPLPISISHLYGKVFKMKWWVCCLLVPVSKMLLSMWFVHFSYYPHFFDWVIFFQSFPMIRCSLIVLNWFKPCLQCNYRMNTYLQCRHGSNQFDTIGILIITLVNFEAADVLIIITQPWIIFNKHAIQILASLNCKKKTICVASNSFPAIMRKQTFFSLPGTG